MQSNRAWSVLVLMLVPIMRLQDLAVHHLEDLDLLQCNCSTIMSSLCPVDHTDVTKLQFHGEDRKIQHVDADVDVT